MCFFFNWIRIRKKRIRIRRSPPEVREPELDVLVDGAEGHLQLGGIEDGNHAQLLVAEQCATVIYMAFSVQLSSQFLYHFVMQLDTGKFVRIILNS